MFKCFELYSRWVPLNWDQNAIYTPKRDNEHPRDFYMGVPPGLFEASTMIWIFYEDRRAFSVSVGSIVKRHVDGAQKQTARLKRWKTFAV